MQLSSFIFGAIAGTGFGAVVTGIISHIVLKDKYEKETAFRIGEFKRAYEAEHKPKEDAPATEAKPPFPVTDTKPADIFKKVDPNRVNYARTAFSNGYLAAEEDATTVDKTKPYIISDVEFNKHSCDHLRLDYYPEADQLLIGEGEDAGTPVAYPNFTVGENNLNHLASGENEIIIVHNPVQNYDYEIYRYSGRPNLNRYIQDPYEEADALVNGGD